MFWNNVLKNTIGENGNSIKNEKHDTKNLRFNHILLIQNTHPNLWTTWINRMYSISSTKKILFYET